MSHTSRRHESRTRTARRGPKNRNEDDYTPHKRLKSYKQTRVNERAQLRKEWR